MRILKRFAYSCLVPVAGMLLGSVVQAQQPNSWTCLCRETSKGLGRTDWFGNDRTGQDCWINGLAGKYSCTPPTTQTPQPGPAPTPPGESTCKAVGRKMTRDPATGGKFQRGCAVDPGLTLPISSDGRIAVPYKPNSLQAGKAYSKAVFKGSCKNESRVWLDQRHAPVLERYKETLAGAEKPEPCPDGCVDEFGSQTKVLYSPRIMGSLGFYLVFRERSCKEPGVAERPNTAAEASRVLAQAKIPFKFLASREYTPDQLKDLAYAVQLAVNATARLHGLNPSPLGLAGQIDGALAGLKGTASNLLETRALVKDLLNGVVPGAGSIALPGGGGDPSMPRGCLSHQLQTMGALDSIARFSSLNVGKIVVGNNLEHHAVVVWPKGTDWERTGVVLDGWKKQSAEPGDMTYTVGDWKTAFVTLAPLGLSRLEDGP